MKLTLKREGNVPGYVTVSMLLSLFLASALAGIYGILHDQITITISREYFLYFKGLEGAGLPDRIGAAYIGWISTWWVGFLASYLLTLAFYFKKQSERLVKRTLAACLKIIIFAAGFGLAGGLYGYGFPREAGGGISFLFPMKVEAFFRFALEYGVTDYRAFYSVWMIHLFGYWGGLAGLGYYMIKILKPKRDKNGGVDYGGQHHSDKG